MTRRPPPPALGYLVVNERGPLAIAHLDDTPPAGVLLRASGQGGGQRATLFPARADALAAIKRTSAYARERWLPWSLDLRVVRLDPPAAPRQDP